MQHEDGVEPQALYETGAGWELKDILTTWLRRGLVTESFQFIPHKWGRLSVTDREPEDAGR